MHRFLPQRSWKRSRAGIPESAVPNGNVASSWVASCIPGYSIMPPLRRKKKKKKSKPATDASVASCLRPSWPSVVARGGEINVHTCCALFHSRMRVRLRALGEADEEEKCSLTRLSVYNDVVWQFPTRAASSGENKSGGYRIDASGKKQNEKRPRSSLACVLAADRCA